jgi:hypothetical protein
MSYGIHERYENYCDVLTKVELFVKEFRQLVISFRLDDYETEGYITLPSEDAKEYEVCIQLKKLGDKFIWFGFDSADTRWTWVSFKSHTTVELSDKMTEMSSSISAVDLEKLTEEYPQCTFENVTTAKTEALSKLRNWLLKDVEGVHNGGGTIPAQAHISTLLRRMEVLSGCSVHIV